MLFNSSLYGAFLVGVFLVFWLVRRHRLARILLLVAVSYGFYFYGTLDAARNDPVPLGPVPWSILCLAIIFVGSTLDYGVGRALGKVSHPTGRKALLMTSIFYYLGVLAVFKYFNFAVDSFVDLLHAVGVNASPVHVKLVLPFGISFFTFETMSYTIDVYRREIEPAKRYLDYLLFVCFFPHLVAGPIVRPHYMLPQFESEPRFDAQQQSEGLWLIATGLLKKVVIGDTLSVTLVKRAFDNPERFSSVEMLVAVYAYAIKIYMDFSGYTDVARGSAKLLGLELPQNFDAPYTAKNLQEFWHRWHISLSTWLRDYLYKPLGGSRGGSLSTYRNLMITMVLGGLWHGARWTFVIWGLLHGAALAATRLWQRRRLAGGGAPEPTWGARVAAGVVTFHYVCFAWIFFNADSVAVAKLILVRIGTGGWGTTNLPWIVPALVALALVAHLLPKTVDAWLRDLFVRTPAFAQGIVLAAAAVGVHLAAGAKAQPFIYGQF